MSRYTLFAALVVACISLTAANAQVTGNDYLKQRLSGAFVYELKLGQNSYFLNNAPGYSINYSYRPRRWLAFSESPTDTAASGIQRVVPIFH